MSEARKWRIGVVGYGNVGAYLVNEIQREGEKYNVELAFVWNRTPTKMEENVEPGLQLRNLDEFQEREADLIVEVAHPSITRTYGELFLSAAHLLVGSPTALADEDTERRLRGRAKLSGYTLYIPSGALWGGEDIMKMADRGTLKGLKITMTKHPKSFKLEGKLAETDLSAIRDRTVLYEGPIRHLCPMAPNNVNTMAAASLAAHTLGFDKVLGVLVADPRRIPIILSTCVYTKEKLPAYMYHESIDRVHIPEGITHPLGLCQFVKVMEDECFSASETIDMICSLQPLKKKIRNRTGHKM